MTVAVVDRDPSWANLLAPALQRAELPVIALTSGAAFLRTVRRTRLRAAILDTSIDDYPPAILLPALRDLHPDVRVILTSAYMTRSLAEVLQETPPFHVILKPVHLPSLLSILTDAVGLPLTVA